MAQAGQITVVGSGNWGTTLAWLLTHAGRAVTLLTRSEDEAATLRHTHENLRYLPGVMLPPSLVISADSAQVLPTSSVILMAVPSQTMRTNVRSLRAHIRPDATVLSCAKGLEGTSLLRMSEVIVDELQLSSERIGALSGPNIAHEIIAGKPAVSVVATPGIAAGRAAQALLTTPEFRIYTSDDVVGVELAGALKNIIALGAGISDGMQAGDNAKAAFMTRGLAEIARLGRALGANPLTFAGLAGLGDLVATCASPHSRNRRLGQ